MQVLETAHQVGRISVSTAPEVSYKEMTLHCESLMMGKQQKMSCLMNTQNRQESLLIRVSQNSDEKEKVTVPYVPRVFHLVISLFILHTIVRLLIIILLFWSGLLICIFDYVLMCSNKI